ncbi:hypothetical protein GCM10027447_10450 [Glycomyces halotolerans]
MRVPLRSDVERNRLRRHRAGGNLEEDGARRPGMGVPRSQTLSLRVGAGPMDGSRASPDLRRGACDYSFKGVPNVDYRGRDDGSGSDGRGQPAVRNRVGISSF